MIIKRIIKRRAADIAIISLFLIKAQKFKASIRNESPLQPFPLNISLLSKLSSRKMGNLSTFSIYGVAG